MDGMLGHWDYDSVGLPKEVSLPAKVTKMSAGAGHMLVLTSDARIFSWGCNRMG